MSEEVKEEIEALMSIYEDDMEVLNETPNYVISMNVRSMNELEDCPTVILRITYPDGYPEENNLQIEFDDEDVSFDAEDLKEMSSVLDEVMEENKGAVMTFLVISATIEWLEQHHERAKLIKEQKERDKKEAEDAILLKKLEGTKVTVESFMAWKKEFDAKQRLPGTGREKKSESQKKLTGKELFLQNSTLN